LKLTPKQISGRATKETRPPTLAAFVEIARQHAMLLHLDVKEAGLQDEIMRMLDEADAWDQVVEVNAGNADRIRAHAKVKLLPYKGWAPEGKYADDPDAIRHALSRDGVMIFTKDPRPVVEFLNRPVSDPTPIPQRTRAPWIPGGVVVSAR
jgi:hypothetical protein